MLHSLLVFLHVLAVSAWLGAALWVPGDVKRSLGLGRPHLDALAARLRPPLGVDAIAAIATLVTGALLMWEEALGMPRAGLIAGIVATLVRMGVLASMRRAARGILSRIQAGEAPAADDPAARRIGMLSGIAHLLWLVALAGMVFPV